VNRPQEGGSWEVRVSLAAVAQWIRHLGQLDPVTAFGEGPPLPPRAAPRAPELTALSINVRQAKPDRQISDSKFEPKTMTVLRHAAVLSATPLKEGEAPMVLEAHEPKWLLSPT